MDVFLDMSKLMTEPAGIVCLDLPCVGGWKSPSAYVDLRKALYIAD